MTKAFDLFGDPIPDGWGERGRPQHIPTQQNRNKVSMLSAIGWSNERIASSLEISRNTLRRYYLNNLEFKAGLRDRILAATLMILWSQCQLGNVAAIKEFRAIIERHDRSNCIGGPQ